jgi:hypothetical protein
MDAHKFRIGESVYYKGNAGAPSGIYVVLTRLPQHKDGEFEYRIRHSRDPHQLKAKERELKATAGQKARENRLSLPQTQYG